MPGEILIEGKDGNAAPLPTPSALEAALGLPSLMEIFMFLAHIFRQYSPSCNIIALVYIERLNSNYGLKISPKNWRAVWVSVIILAQKIWDDISIKTSEFVKLLPTTSRSQLKSMEYRVLELLRYQVIVKSSEYAKHYFDLRKRYCELSGCADVKWEFRPLTLAKAKRVEAIEFSRRHGPNEKTRGRNVVQKEYNFRTFSPMIPNGNSAVAVLSLSYGVADSRSEAKKTTADMKALPRGMNTFEDITRIVDVARLVIS